MYGNRPKHVCCTCLSEDRKLIQLCRVQDGVNLLYMLLMCDTDAYREGFFTDTASWMVCWECCAIINRIRRFQRQTCTALTRLKDTNGWNKEIKLQSLSSLKSCFNSPIEIEIDSFVNCHMIENNDLNKIKTENLQIIREDDLADDFESDSNRKVKKNLKKTEKSIINIKELYTVTFMDIEEFKNEINRRKSLLRNVIQCDSCVIEFENEIDLKEHNLENHTKKENHSPCNLCQTYINNDILDKHTTNHYQSYVCKICDYRVCTYELIKEHLKGIHRECFRKKKKQPKRNLKSDEPVKYACSECEMMFENRCAKWKHIQKCHRDGHQCGTCQKVFAFKHSLRRHELIHKSPQPRTECPECHKQVLTYLVSKHALTHGDRSRTSCVPCGKVFVSRASYESHLKYATAHAVLDVRRHACSACDKKFRSRRELRDHVAYRHDKRASHKCPVCDKLLATRRCVTRHVRRAHDGIKETARDKMCDYCGKAFRSKLSLTEHVSRHTGARPLACSRCGRAFRHRAALYTHTRRLHPDA